VPKTSQVQYVATPHPQRIVLPSRSQPVHQCNKAIYLQATKNACSKSRQEI